MYLGYNTNGLAHHDLFDAVAILAEIGYRGVGITIIHRTNFSEGEAGLSGKKHEVGL